MACGSASDQVFGSNLHGSDMHDGAELWNQQVYPN